MREFYGNTFIDLDKQEREAINLPFLFRTPFCDFYNGL